MLPNRPPETQAIHSGIFRAIEHDNRDITEFDLAMINAQLRNIAFVPTHGHSLLFDILNLPFVTKDSLNRRYIVVKLLYRFFERIDEKKLFDEKGHRITINILFLTVPEDKKQANTLLTALRFNSEVAIEFLNQLQKYLFNRDGKFDSFYINLDEFLRFLKHVDNQGNTFLHLAQLVAIIVLEIKTKKTYSVQSRFNREFIYNYFFELIGLNNYFRTNVCKIKT